jgi:opacity protein-like surface antigen
MRNLITSLTALVVLLSVPASPAGDQDPVSRSGVHLTAGPGLLTSGAYFTGPGGLALDNSDALAGVLQVIVPVHPSFSLIAGGAYARPEWRVAGVPLVGTIGVDGASLWFAEAGARGEVPVGGQAGTGPTAFAQVGAGVAHYSLETSVLGRAVDESATNFALALGAGLGVPITERIGLELLAQDYVVSFRSVRDLEALGVEGRRAHTLVLSVSARVGL